jgi:hypothetical protein
MPDNLRYGGEVAFANPVYLLATLLAGVLILLLRRDKAAAVFVFAGLIIPLGQAVTIAGAHFHMLRFLALFGLIRIFKDRGVYKDNPRPLHPIDRAFVWLSLITFAASNVLFHNLGNFIYSTGMLYTSLACYFVVRHLLREEQDVLAVSKTLVAVGVIASVTMVIEQMGHIDLFGFLGGVPLHPAIREGRYRSEAMFAHSIIAGCYGATLFPLGIWMWAKKSGLRLYALVAIVCSVVMVVTSASSTPIMAFAGAILAFCFWPLRKQMKWVRRGIVLMLVSLHMVMKAPVWQLIARIDIVGGNSADHRYQLVNQTIRHFSEWWLCGTAANDDWGWDMWDTANAFVGTAISAGIFGLIFFLALFSRSFRAIGNARASFDADRSKDFQFWSLGALMFTQLMVFVGISYFDQAILTWYVLLCMIVVLTAQEATASAAVTDPSAMRTGFARIWRARTDPVPEGSSRLRAFSGVRWRGGETNGTQSR